MKFNFVPEKQGLYDPRNEHDACGIAAIANINGEKTHKLIVDVLDILVNLEHRGGMGAENNTGDGAGILIQLPHKFFKSQILEFDICDEGDYGVAQLFLSKNESNKEIGKDLFVRVVEENNLEFLGFREVPINPCNLGETAVKAMPYIVQGFVKRPINISKGKDFERLLYLVRRQLEKQAIKLDLINKFYVCSFSSKTIVYKGMLLATQVRDFYLDLKNTNFESAIGMVHSRFSTNTFPSWDKAHPNRYIIHNGEINTIRGNVNSMKAREGIFKSPVFKDDFNKILPVIPYESSDSAMFDNSLEFFMMNGRNIEEAIMMMIPEPWTKDKMMDKDKRAFYEYYSTMLEPWDGPASIIFTDGDVLGATLDRNGLRPSRYYLTKDGYLILSSETGAYKVDESNILAKNRLEAGKILLVDTISKRLITDEELKLKYSKTHPYKEWTKELLKLDNIKIKGFKEEDETEARRIILEKVFGYTDIDIIKVILPMSKNKEEPIAAMGYDGPLAVLSNNEDLLYSYFKQQFAQVTNPPIDVSREEIITSLRVYVGKEGNILDPKKEHARRIKLNSPIINNEDLYKLKHLEGEGFKSICLPILFDIEKNNMEQSLEDIFNKASEAIKDGVSIIILSDRNVDSNKAAIPALLAASGLHQHLTRTSERTKASIIVETAEAREIHHFACLCGFGVTCINPYLAFDVIKTLVDKNVLNLSYDEAIDNYIKASSKGILKVASKMGLSTLQSYNGSQLFECLGLSDDVIKKYFTDSKSVIGGIGLDEISKEVIIRHNKAFKETIVEVSFEERIKNALRSKIENHLYNPLVIHKLQTACKKNDYNLFKEYTNLINNKDNPVHIRDLLEFDCSEEISIDEVESVDSIVRRFRTGGISYGSISEEVHETIAVAMNRLNAKSNSGEGGENPHRYLPLENGDNLSSAIKQVASGRFGVTIEYLNNAKEIQIKIAQGAKPGEGGQLPANKVYPWIAKARHSTPGVALISPPPHHDIYSIEDLAQLIFDLKNANKNALISVKLVSESGVGTIASGVVKAGANVILISGYDGGTGASPRTSIKNAGLPWEIGLAETHQTLVLNKLRDRVIIETDGKIMSGRDLAVAALLGSEEYGFATAPLIVLGCAMLRVCNLDTCPMGIATQNEKLRERFKGKPEHLVSFMRFIAEELREYMAKMGFKKINEMIGRTDKLIVRKVDGWKNKLVNLDKILYSKNILNKTAVHFNKFKNVDLNKTLDERVIVPLCKEALENKKKVNISLEVSNVDRTLGTILSSEITKKYGSSGLDDDTIIIEAVGNAGNSSGAFLTKGVTLKVVGDANDYIGKGLCGGKICVTPSNKATFNFSENMIVGNVCLYGGTDGEIYINGLAGERFAVRNSGVTAVLLGLGAHGCEYMTGGRVLVLGNIGRNFAAGMSGGYAYLLKNDNNLNNINMKLVEVDNINDNEESEIKELMKNHIKYTNSSIVRSYLDNFNKNDFIKVMPKDYKKMIESIKYYENQGLDYNESRLEAFKAIIK